MDALTARSAAKLLNVTRANLELLVKKGLIHSYSGLNDKAYYSRREIDEIMTRKGLTIAEEAAQVESQIQRAMANTLSNASKTLIVFGALVLGYTLLVAVLTVLFMISPLRTAEWVGIVKEPNEVLVQAEYGGQVLGEATGDNHGGGTWLQAILEPVGRVALGIVKNIKPPSYAEIARVAIIDPNDVLTLDTSGAIIPVRPINLTESSLLQVGSSELVTNLNSEYLQGLKPGNSLGDIALVSQILPVEVADVQGVTIESLEPISGGGVLPLGGKISLNCPSCLVGSNKITVSAGSGLTGGGLTTLGGSTSLAVAGLTTTHFGSTSISQWSNDSGYMTSEVDTLATVFGRGNAISTTTGSTANSIDEATLKVGSIASTDAQNFATLNITNGGSGFLDVELIRGFINFQGMNTLYDDFTSRSLDTDNRWTVVSTGGGSTCEILSGGVGGILRMDSGSAANRGCELSTQDIDTLTGGYYQRSNNPIMETKLKINVVTNARIVAGFTNTRVAVSSDTNPSTHHAYIVKRASDTTWQCVTDDGGATETTTNTGVTIVAGTFYRLRVELRSGTVPQTICTVDDGTSVTRTVVTNTQPGSTSAMDLYIKLNQSDGVSKNMDIDYVRTWQDDPTLLSFTGDGNLIASPDAHPAEDEAQAVENTEEIKITEDTSDPDTPEEIPFPEWVVEAIRKEVAKLAELWSTKFGRDTAGHAMIRVGEREVSVKFEREYENPPVVTVSINLVGEILEDPVPSYAVYDVDNAGFVIRLLSPAESNRRFSWVALAVEDEVVAPSPEASPDVLLVSPEPTPFNLEASPSAELIVL